MKDSPAELISTVLSGSWRPEPEPLDVTADGLNRISRQLLASGAAALAWRRARISALKDSPASQELRQAYKLQTLHSGLHEREILEVLSRLREDGVEPILVKGWAVARAYPEKGLRPYGDIDLIVRPKHLPAANTVLAHPRAEMYNADLDHKEFASMSEARIEGLFDRSRLVPLGDSNVRVLAAEDHLVFLCLHALRHGAWRPLWLCDIAAELEARPADFDWDLCLGGGRRQSDWVACAIGLAHRLVGANLDRTPLEARATNLPGWLISSVLEQWENPYPMEHAPFNYRAPMATYLRHPAGLLRDLLARWPNKIEATISVGGPMNRLPRLPFQIGNGLLRIGRFAVGLRSGLGAGNEN
ncbi:MAG TPA: nucleotidyltransferase family protein [Blastocatellia bacterium]|nr:nucleotidyltransferase family protein [Blastocatellia bacterium]